MVFAACSAVPRKEPMNLRGILIISLGVFGLTSFAEAKYDRALDGKTKVWHNVAQRRVQASWSGGRDEKGYATGKGTLTWFRAQRSWQTGSLLPKTKYVQVSQYKGKMVEGKLEGSVVSVGPNGKTYRAKFADGQRTGEWVASSAPSSRKSPEPESPRPKVAETTAGEAPAPAPKLNEQPATTQADESAGPTVDTQPTAPNESTARTEDSLQALAKPPSSLRPGGTAEASPQSSAPTVNIGEQGSSKSSAAEVSRIREEEHISNVNPSSPPPAASAPAASPVQSDDARAVAALDSEYHSAVKTNDAATIDRILADDFVLVHGAGQTFTKTDVLKQARDKQVKYEHHEVEPGTQKVRVWRDTAVVTETLWVKGSQNGAAVDQKMAVTETYVRTPNGWRYVSGQASVPEP